MNYYDVTAIYFSDFCFLPIENSSVDVCVRPLSITNSTMRIPRWRPSLCLALLFSVSLPFFVSSFQTAVHISYRFSPRSRRFVKEQQQSDTQPNEALASEVFTPSPNDSSNDIEASVDPDVVRAIENEEEEDEDDPECLVGTEQSGKYCIPLRLVSLPRHSHAVVNKIMIETERTLCDMHANRDEINLQKNILEAKEVGRSHERIYANNYVDLGKIDTCVAFIWF